MANIAATTVGFVGLGLMGRPMARNLAKAGAKLVLNSRTLANAEAFAATIEGAIVL